MLVYRDANGNAARDIGETILPGAVISVTNMSGVVMATFVTDGTEPRCFSGFAEGVYLVSETDPSGYTSTTPNLLGVYVTTGTLLTLEFGDQPGATPTPTATQPRKPSRRRRPQRRCRRKGKCVSCRMKIGTATARATPAKDS